MRSTVLLDFFFAMKALLAVSLPHYCHNSWILGHHQFHTRLSSHVDFKWHEQSQKTACPASLQLAIKDPNRTLFCRTKEISKKGNSCMPTPFIFQCVFSLWWSLSFSRTVAETESGLWPSITILWVWENAEGWALSSVISKLGSAIYVISVTVPIPCHLSAHMA